MDRWDKCIIESLKKQIAESKDGNITITIEAAKTILSLIIKQPIYQEKSGAVTVL